MRISFSGINATRQVVNIYYSLLVFLMHVCRELFLILDKLRLGEMF